MWPFSLVRSMIAPPPVDLAARGELAHTEAVRLFTADIYDPPRSDRRPVAERWRDEITAMIASDAGLG